jgi:cytidylate kinase
MLNVDPLTYIKTVLAKEFATQPKPPREPEPKSLVITLSRDYGAEGEAIAQGLAERLNLSVYDQEILDRVAISARTDKFRFEAHDEQSNAGISAFLYSLVSGNPATLRDYRRHLCAAVVDLARHDCLIIGRGAHLILSGKKVFRVRVVGSKSVCARRISVELNLSPGEAERKVTEINQKRHQAIMDLFHDSIEHCSLEHADLFDLVINTDQITASAAVNLILLGLQETGHIPEIPPCKA